MRKPFTLADNTVKPGERSWINVPIPDLIDQARISMPVHVIHGKRPGPVLFISAAIHGDELNGIEIIRSVLASKSVGRLHGTLIAVPVVNAYGLVHQSRYLPDRRDLNRVFPGSKSGSLAARLAHLFMHEIVAHCTHGIDLHTGSGNRTNLPQIRANLDHSETRKLARCFGVPVLLNASLRDGSLRAAANALGIPMLLYEAGEALRYNDLCIRAGRTGIFNVMRVLGMLPASQTGKINKPFVARSSRWIRAPRSGLFKSSVRLGKGVTRGDVIGYIAEPSTGESHPVYSSVTGVAIVCLSVPWFMRVMRCFMLPALKMAARMWWSR